MGEYVLQIDKAFEASGMKIDEVGVAFAEKSMEPVDTMSSPQAVVIVEGSKLGIYNWALKPLFTYSMETFLKRNSSLRRDEITLNEIHAELISLSRAILLVKDSFLVLDVRKKLICDGYLMYSEEVNFLTLLLPRHPKSSCLWQHRRWCLYGGYSPSFPLSINRFDEQVMHIELNLCSYIADIFPRNYFSWMHRMWLLQFMHKIKLHEENNFCKNWLLNHVSDHSASNHKIQVILRLVYLEGGDKSAILNIFESMLMESADIISRRPGVESMWYHRRNLIELLLETLSSWNIVEYTDDKIEFIIIHFSSFLSIFHRGDINRNGSESHVSILFEGLRELVARKDNSSIARKSMIINWLSAEADFILSFYTGIWGQENQRSFMHKYLKFSLCRFLKFLYQNMQVSMDDIVAIYTKLGTNVIIHDVVHGFGQTNHSVTIVETISFIVNNYVNVLLAKTSMKN